MTDPDEKPRGSLLDALRNRTVTTETSSAVPRGLRVTTAYAWRFLVIAAAIGVAIWLIIQLKLLVIPLLIAVLIVPRAITLLREVFAVLGERAPAGTKVADIRAHILGTDGVVDVHDVHVWQLTRGAPVFTAHVVVSPELFADDQAGGLLSQLQTCLARHFDVEHSTFQLEPAGHVEHDAHA
jgi:cobalt-zinc-cadmium efflux system protein